MTMSTTNMNAGSITSTRPRAGVNGNGAASNAAGGEGAGAARGLRSALGLWQDGADLKLAMVQQADGGRISVQLQQLRADDAAGLKAQIERLNPDGLAVVLQPGSCVVKTVKSAARPTGSSDQIASALALMAEAESPGQAPEYRRACVVVQAGKASNLLALGWTSDGPKGLNLQVLTAKRSGKIKAAFVPSTLALVGLARGLRLDETRPGVIAASMTKASGPATLLDAIALGHNKEGEATLQARSTLTADQAGVNRMIEQMAAGSMISQLREWTEETSPVRVLVPASSDDGVALGGLTGVSFQGSQASIGTHGLAIGAAIMLMQQRATELPGLAMSQLAPGNKGPWWERLLTWPGTPLRLGIIAAAGLAIIGAAWLGSSLLQANLLRQQLGLSGDSAGDDKATSRALAQSDWFKLQRDYRVPVASILAELAGTAPAGVTIENLAIDQSFPNTGRVITVTLSGTSPSAETVNQWRSELLKRGTFSEVPGPTVDESVQPARYTLTPRLSDVMKLAAAKVKPLPPLAPARTVNAEEGKPATTRVNEPPPANPAPAATTPNRPAGTGAATAAAPEIPPALTDAQIAAMTSREATNQWARRRGLLQNPLIEADVKSRLEDEVRKIDARRNELRGQPATPPASGATP
jgi:hypothetical protein